MPELKFKIFDSPGKENTKETLEAKRRITNYFALHGKPPK